MKKLLMAVLLIAGHYAPAQDWTTESAAVSFKIRNAGIAVKGTFDSLALSLKRTGNTWKDATLSGAVFAGSIDTGIGLRDKHLRGEDYFEAETHPWIRMESTSLRPPEQGRLEGTFRLTIKEYTREIPLVFTYQESTGKITMETAFELNRREFGLGGKSLILSDRVRVSVNAVFSKTQ
jgi:polyisoprenoid-binding protein YceI